MTTKRLTAISAISALGIGLGIAAAGPAAAATRTFTDPLDTHHGSDLRAVVLKHTADDLVIRTRHLNLRRDPSSGSGGSVYIDTDPTDRGPEYVFVGGYFVGTDYQLLETEGFGHKNWGMPVEGEYRMTVDYAEERVTFRISRESLGTPQQVRVAVRVAGTRSDGTSKGLVDWLGDAREFTPWVASA